MNKRNLEVGDVMQIDPEHDPVFGGCFMVVAEPKSWGAQGHIQVPAQKGGQAYYRCDFAAMEFVGKAVFVLASDSEE